MDSVLCYCVCIFAGNNRAFNQGEICEAYYGNVETEAERLTRKARSGGGGGGSGGGGAGGGAAARY